MNPSDIFELMADSAIKLCDPLLKLVDEYDQNYFLLFGLMGGVILLLAGIFFGLYKLFNTLFS